MRKKVIIIAEAGVNHNGDIETAKRLIDVAADAKVDYVKFQTFKADTIVSLKAKKANYQSNNYSDTDQFQYNMLKKLELSHNDHLILMNYAKKRNINFFSTAFDVDGLKYLDSLGFPFFKIPSGELTNYPYLRAVALLGKPVILSTGMANLKEIQDAINVLLLFGLTKKLITVLHCNTEYPTPMKDVNLNAMLQIKKELKVEIGYSDHTLGIEVPTAAVAMGAIVIEKHFTLNRNLPGPDHQASLEPKELKDMVISIRNIELALSGNGIKELSESEKKNLIIARKSIHINTNLKKGEKINEKNLIPLRPGNGISAMEWDKVIGKIASKDLYKNDMLNWRDLL